MTLAWQVLFSAAITLIFTQGSIFEPLREHGPKLWRDLVSCALCCGVWIGGAVAAIAARGSDFTPILAVQVLGVGCASGPLALLVVRAIEALEKAAE